MKVTIDDPVPLVRRFCPAFQSDDDSEKHEVRALLGYPNSKTWQEIDTGYRSVILAEAGAGKTFEMRARARYVEEQGNPSFFIRIEDIVDAFEDSFEVGCAEIIHAVARFPGRGLVLSRFRRRSQDRQSNYVRKSDLSLFHQDPKRAITCPRLYFQPALRVAREVRS